ncbi:uncharacterized protein J8A68_005262 [[Candida] subhashii]|uniref:Phosphoglycerate mutase n=1 Tax=[Candida] subhashii TaxID=561895 RepID=A0A8J5Q6Z8_9ASCO|nr:uncharacterized protein J8A68_005262 [[Candida] subhashii]KAG7661266.1 hypothetical protein J8A68_005262 [[Candida] subhashii]
MFYTSPYLRTRQTCNNIIEGIKDLEGVEYTVREEPRMREQDFGNFQQSAEEMEKIWEERAHYGHFFYRIPYGESAADVYDRVASFNESLFRQFKFDNFPNVLVLVSHGIWSRVFLMKWFRWTFEDFESLKNIPHCQYLIMKQNLKTSKFNLKTPLLTWDDVDDDDMESEICKEVVDELNTNKWNVLSAEDMDVSSIIQAQKRAINSTREKNKRIQEMFHKIQITIDPPPNGNNNTNNNNNKLSDKLSPRFKYDNQSVANSTEEIGSSGCAHSHENGNENMNEKENS